MTFQKFVEILKTKYPDAEAYAHDTMCGGVPHYKQKTAIAFVKGGKLRHYSGAYEDVLTKVGIPTITHERLDPIIATLEMRKAEHGATDMFFGVKIDNSVIIEQLEARIAEIKSTYFIV